MKKSILFSSIATTCCLLIQNSASAEWASFSGSVTHDYEWTSNTYGFPFPFVGKSIYDSSNNWGGNHNAMSQSFSFSQGGMIYSSDTMKGTLFFSVTETLELSIISNLSLAGIGSLNNSWSLSKYTAGSWVEISSLQNLNTRYVRDTHLITLESQTDYQIILNQNGNIGSMSSYNASFNMSLTPVPAPGVSALLALAGFVSRRRRA
jgi:hypothetical protein